MTKPNTVDTILDDVQNHVLYYTDGETDVLANQRQLAHKQLYKEMLGVIGEDIEIENYDLTKSSKPYYDGANIERNTLRAEQRLALNKLFGMEE